MTYVGHFWFVPANIRTYSALVADTVPLHETRCIAGVRQSPRNPRCFWDDLASRDPQWLRRRGWPISMAGRTLTDFAGGTVSYEKLPGQFEVEMDGELTSPDFAQEVVAHFGIPLERTQFRWREAQARNPIGLPKPWY